MRNSWLTIGLSLLVVGCSGPMRSALPDDASDSAREAAKGCDRGEAVACATLAQMYWVGEGVARDVDVAVPLLFQACAAGRDDLCAVSEEVALGSTPHSDRLTDARACDRGDSGACAGLGLGYRDGDGVTADLDHANRLFVRACEAGHDDACVATEWMRVRGATAPVVASAAACDAGQRDACRQLGDARWTGQGVDVSVDEAVRLHDQVCADGDVVVCAALGDRFMDGDGVTRDIDRAVVSYRAACNGGYEEACGRSYEVRVGDAPSSVIEAARDCDRADVDGCVRLADAFAVGDEVAADPGFAADLYDSACESGRPGACLALAELRQAGEGVARDAIQAASLFATACEGGELRACFELGSLYHSGDGVPRNIEAAFTWWQRACDGGLQQACDEMPGRAEAELPPTAPDTLRNLARQCDRGTLRSCLELGIAREAGQGIPRDYDAANRIYTRACFSGFGEACEAVRFPGPCSIDHVDEQGAVLRTESLAWDRAALAELGVADAPSSAVTLDETSIGLPDVLEPPRLDLPNVTLEQAENPNHWAAGTELNPVTTGVVDVSSPNGAAARLTFDAAGRLVAREPVPGAVGETVRVQRDADGRIIAADVTVPASGSRRLTLNHDPSGRVVSLTRVDQVGPLDRTTTWTYTRGVRGLLSEVVRDTQSRSVSGDVETEWLQARFIRDDRGNLLRSDIRDENRVVLEAANYEYGCFLLAEPVEP